MTRAVNDAQATATALDRLARATIGNAGTLPVSELYSMVAELVDASRHLAQVLSHINNHATARALRVELRLDASGHQRFGHPHQAVTETWRRLATASAAQDDVTRGVDEALVALSTLAETESS